VLREWRDDDVAPFLAMSSDPEVMHFYSALYDRAATDAAIARWTAHIAAHGFGICVVEHAGVFAGVAGLATVPCPSPIAREEDGHPVEVGWRLARPFWGRGFATEAAHAWLGYGFHAHDLDEIVAMVLPANTRSVAVMQRLGMVRDAAADFVHPKVTQGGIGVGGQPLNPHHLYRIRRAAFRPFHAIQTLKT
jgi:RimJ/RimL family protein N-acetyltransferase